MKKSTTPAKPKKKNLKPSVDADHPLRQFMPGTRAHLKDAPEDPAERHYRTYTDSASGREIVVETRGQCFYPNR